LGPVPIRDVFLPLTYSSIFFFFFFFSSSPRQSVQLQVSGLFSPKHKHKHKAVAPENPLSSKNHLGILVFGLVLLRDHLSMFLISILQHTHTKKKKEKEKEDQKKTTESLDMYKDLQRNAMQCNAS